MINDLWGTLEALDNSPDEKTVWDTLSGFLKGFGFTALVYRTLPIAGPQSTEIANNDNVELSLVPGGEQFFSVMNFGFEEEIQDAGFNLEKIEYWKNSFVLPHIYENNKIVDQVFSYKKKLAGLLFPRGVVHNKCCRSESARNSRSNVCRPST